MTTQGHRGTSTLRAIGFAGGVSGGMLGGGTGVVTVPALAATTDLPRARIHGTATMANVSAALVGSVVYAASGGRVDLQWCVGLMIGGVIGAPLGATYVARVPERVLRRIFVAILALTAIKYALTAIGLGAATPSAILPAGTLRDAGAMLAMTFVLGAAIGAYSAAMGLGGGTLLVPAMSILLGANLHVAEGTSLLVMLPTAVIGAATHVRHGTADRRIGFTLAIFALPGTAVGVLISLSLPDQALAAILMMFIGYLTIREVRKLRHTERPAAVVGHGSAEGHTLSA